MRSLTWIDASLNYANLSFGNWCFLTFAKIHSVYKVILTYIRLAHDNLVWVSPTYEYEIYGRIQDQKSTCHFSLAIKSIKIIILPCVEFSIVLLAFSLEVRTLLVVWDDRLWSAFILNNRNMVKQTIRTKPGSWHFQRPTLTMLFNSAIRNQIAVVAKINLRFKSMLDYI